MFARRLLVAVGVLALAAVPVRAQTWVPTAAGTYAWNLDANWNATPFPDSPTAIANVNNNITGNQTIELNDLIDLQSLLLGDTTTVSNTFTIAAGTGGSLRFNGAATLTGSSGATATISAPITLASGAGLTISRGGAGLLTIGGGIDTGTGAGQTLTFGTSGDSNGLPTAGINVSAPITGDGNVVKSGSNFVHFTAANTYTGTTTISGGAIRLSGAGTLGTGNLNWSGGQFFPGATFTRAVGTGAGEIQWTGTATKAFGAIGQALTVNLGNQPTPATVTWGVGGFVPTGTTFGLGTLSSTHTVTFVNGIDLNGGARTLEVLNGSAVIDAVLGGVLSDSLGGGGLTKTGVGILRLDASPTFSGVLRVGEGTLIQGTGVTIAGNLAVGGNATVFAPDPSTPYTASLGTGAGQIDLAPSGSTVGGTFGAIGGNVTVSLGGVGTPTPIVWGTTANWIPTGQNFGLSSAASDGTVTFANPIDLNGATRTISVNNGTAQIDAIISGALSGGAGSGLTKTGTGTVRLDASPTHTGVTRIENGVLALNTGVTIPGNVAVTANGAFSPGPNVTYTASLGTGAGQIDLAPAGGTGGGGFAAVGGPVTVSLGGVATPTPIVWGTTANFVPAGQSLAFSSLSSDSTVTFANPIDLNGAPRTIQVNNGTAAVDAVLTGAISGAGGLTKSGDGLLELTAANTYTGTTTISGGGLRPTGTGTISGGNLTLSGGQFFPGATFIRAVGTGDDQVQLTAGNTGFGTIGQDLTVNLGGGGTVTWGTTTFNPGRLVLGSTNSNGTVFFANSIDTGGTAAREVRADNGSAAVDAVLTGAISGTGGLTAGGDGTLVVSGTNTYTGETLVGANGVLRVQSADGLGGIGAGGHTKILGLARTNRVELSGGITTAEPFQIEGRTAANLSPALSSFSGNNTLTGNITFNAGGVEYNLHSNTGAGFTIAGTITNTLGTGTTTRNVNLLGGGTGTITGVVSNGVGTDPIAIIKQDSGTWTLGGANPHTYAGVTTVNAGTLRVNGTLAAGGGAVAVNSGGTFGGTGTVNRAVTVASGGTLAPGAGGAGVLTVANASGTAVDLPSGANFGVRITGGNPSGTLGGSTDSVTIPTTNNVLRVTAGTASINPGINVVVDWTGMSFTLEQQYSYQVGQVDGQDLSTSLNITDPARFQFAGLLVSQPSLTGNESGAIFLTFTPVPEPGLVLLAGAVGLGLAGRWRGRRQAGTRIV